MHPFFMKVRPMPFVEVFIIALSLSMDAFAVAVCKGACMIKVKIKNCFLIALFFGLFQAFMPFVGWLVGSRFEQCITSFDHWIAFGLLSFIGVKMIQEARNGDDACDVCSPLSLRELLVLSIATSIDALAAGIVFAIEKISINVPVLIIGLTTFALSFIGSLLGNRVGEKFKKKAQLVGGIVLILIGLKILVEHLHSA